MKIRRMSGAKTIEQVYRDRNTAVRKTFDDQIRTVAEQIEKIANAVAADVVRTLKATVLKCDSCNCRISTDKLGTSVVSVNTGFVIRDRHGDFRVEFDNDRYKQAFHVDLKTHPQAGLLMVKLRQLVYRREMTLDSLTTSFNDIRRLMLVYPNHPDTKKALAAFCYPRENCNEKRKAKTGGRGKARVH